MARYDFEVIGSEQDIQLRRITSEDHVKVKWGVGVPGQGDEVYEVCFSFPERDDSTIAALLHVPQWCAVQFEAVDDPASDHYWTEYARRLYEMLKKEIEHG